MTGKRLPTLILPRFLLTRYVGSIIRDLFLLRPRKWQTTPILVKISVFVRMGFSVWGSRFEDGHPFVRFLWFPPWYFRVIFNTRLLVPILNNRREGDR